MDIKNILLAINVRWWNAEAAYALNVARGLLAMDLPVWVIVNKNSPVHQKALEYNVPVLTDIDLDSYSPIRQWQNFRKIGRFVEKHNIDVINSFKSNGSFLFNLIRIQRPALTYIKTRGEARPPKYHFLNDYFYGKKSCDGIIAAGDQVKNWISKLKIGAQNIQTIYFGDPGLNKTSLAESAVVRSRLNIPGDTPVFALLGRTQKVKGHQILLNAINQLPNRNFHLLFLVKDLDEFPGELQAIRDFIDANDLTDQVTILGFQKNLPEVLSCVNLGIIPSIASEVNCRVAVEFFSMGIPVIAFPTGSLPDIIQHQKTGYLCFEGNEAELALGIQWTLDNKGLWPELGKNAHQSYMDNFTLERLAKMTLEFYQFCFSDKNRINQE